MNQTISVLKNLLEDRKIKDKQLSSLRAKEIEFVEKESELSKLLEQARLKHDDCIRANLAGNISDQQLRESKDNLKELTNSVQEIKESLRILVDLKNKLMSELSITNGDLSVHREILCGKLSQEKYTELSKDKKLYEKLIAGYAAFYRSTELIKSWESFLVKCFERPSEEAMRLAEDKLRQSHELLRD